MYNVFAGQSRAILATLCKHFGIGSDLSVPDYAKSEELVDHASDIHNMLGKAHYGSDRTVAMDAIFGEGGGVKKALGAFEDVSL